MNEYINFELSEQWYNDRFGTDFSEDFWTDPIRRTESYRELTYQVAKRFPSLGLGSLEPTPDPKAADQYGHRFVPKLFGCDMVYTRNQAPACISHDYDFDVLAELDMPDLARSDVFKKGLSDAKELKAKYGFVHSAINAGGPVNAAVSIFGESFIACCVAEPEIAQHVMMVIAKTIIRLNYEFEDAINPPTIVERRSSGLGNCPVIMFSPKVYQEVIQPVELWYRQQFRSFGLHHCGVFDQYAQVYTALKPDYMDIGGGSDYKILRKHFPNVGCTFIVNPELYEGKTTAQIDALVKGIVTDGGPTEHIIGLHTYSVGKNATDDNIVDLRTSIVRQGLV